MTSTQAQTASRRTIVVSTQPEVTTLDASSGATPENMRIAECEAHRALAWLSARFWLWWSAGLAICMGWDRAAWLAVSHSGKSSLQWLEDASGISVLWQRLGTVSGLTSFAEFALSAAYAGVYFFGRIYVWVILAIVMIFRDWASSDTDRVRVGLRRGVFVFLCPAAAGLLAEALKLITRRARPEHADGVYRFIAPEGGVLDAAFWDPAGLGLASSHASVAIAGALALGLLAPTLRWWLIALAGACAASRVLVGAHYLSDVYAGLTIGAGAVALIYAWDRRNNRGAAIDAVHRGVRV